MLSKTIFQIIVTVETEEAYNPGRNALAEQAFKSVRAERDNKML